jgi:FMN phosphatase YigB (HAD superfamily)
MNNQFAAAVLGVIFDLDGTLYDMSWYMKPLFFLRLFPASIRLPRFLHIRETFAGKDLTSRQCLIETLSGELSKTEGVSPDQARKWIEGPFYASFVAIMPFLRFSRPGIIPLLSSLRDKGLRLGVLSDYDCVKERLEKLSVPPSLFDTVASSEAFGALKPNGRPYSAIAQEWGIAPRNILVVGDRADTDGAAAAALGMQFLLIENSPRKRRPGKGLCWKELRDMLANIDKVVAFNQAPLT